VRIAVVNKFLSALASFVFLVQPALAAKTTLREPQTGLTLVAPSGFKIGALNGVYTLTNGKVFARFMLGRSPLSITATASSVIKITKAKVFSKTSSGGSLIYNVKLAGHSLVMIFSKRQGYISVATYGKGRIAAAASRSRSSGLTTEAAQLPGLISANDLATLRRAINTQRGGVSVPLQVNIPTRVFRALDGTTAVVPNLAGWSFNGGGGGIISGQAVGQGVFELGVPSVVSYPGFSGPLISPFVSAAQAIAQVWPQYTHVYTGVDIQVTGVQEVTGTDGFLAPDFVSSGMFGISFILNGEVWQGLMTSGVTPLPGAELLSFIWYHSFIAVPANGPGGIGPALVNTWATWNHSAADQQRLAQAVKTLLSIHVSGGGPIDPDVFQNAADAWDGYIRDDPF